MNHPSSRLHRILSCILPLVAAGLLAACAARHGSAPERQPGSEGAVAPGAMHGASSGGMTGQPGMMGRMDAAELRAMCDAHKRMLAAKTPDDRRAMMDENMRNMPPDEFQRQMDMLQSHCR